MMAGVLEIRGKRCRHRDKDMNSCHGKKTEAETGVMLPQVKDIWAYQNLKKMRKEPSQEALE